MGIVIALSLFSISFSKIFDIVLSKEMGRWFEGCLVSFPGLGSMIIEASFHGSGKYSRRAHPLKMWQR